MRRHIYLLLLSATFATAQQPKRPMTFEDMMHMKRLGSTAVSPDGKWLGYSVTTVDLAQNTKTAELWLQPIAGGDPIKLAVAQPGDDGLQFPPTRSTSSSSPAANKANRSGSPTSIPPPAQLPI